MNKILLSFVVASCCFTIANSQTISTIAGNHISGNTGDGGQATAAKLDNPNGIALIPGGGYYITAPAFSVIRKIDNNGIISRIAGIAGQGFGGDGGPATAATLNGPISPVLDANGNLYFADYINNRIREINTSGVITTVVGSAGGGHNTGDGGPATAAGLSSPDAIVFDATGNMYIDEYGNYDIRKVNTSGIISTIAGNGVAGYTGDGGAATAAELDDNSGIALDANGNLYIADLANNVIREVNTSGIISTAVGNGVQGFSGDGGPATASELTYPVDVKFDQAGNMYIADENNDAIRKVSTSGIITTIAGILRVTGYSGDGGPATAAELYYPDAMALDANSDIYIADGSNYVIRKITYPLAVNEIGAGTANFNIYPNPTSGKFTISSTNLKLEMNGIVEIYNVLGEKVYTQQFERHSSAVAIDLGSSASGIYMYRIIDETGDVMGTGKFIIQ